MRPSSRSRIINGTVREILAEEGTTVLVGEATITFDVEAEISESADEVGAEPDNATPGRTNPPFREPRPMPW